MEEKQKTAKLFVGNLTYKVLDLLTIAYLFFISGDTRGHKQRL